MSADRSANSSAAASGGIAVAIIGLMVGFAVISIALIVVSVIFAVWLAWKAFRARTDTERLIYGGSSVAVIVVMLVGVLAVKGFIDQKQGREDLAQNKEQFLGDGPDLVYAALTAERPDWTGPQTGIQSDQRRDATVAVPLARATVPIQFEPLYVGKDGPALTAITAYTFKQLDRLHSLPSADARYAKCSIARLHNIIFESEKPRNDLPEFGKFVVVACKADMGSLVFPAVGIGDWSMANGREFSQTYLKVLCQQYTDNVRQGRGANWDGPKSWNLHACNPA